MKNLFLILSFLVSFAAYAQTKDSTTQKPFSFEANISSTNVWLLNGVAYGLNEPNIALNLQYNNPVFYTYVYKANSLVKPVSDGNYAMIGVGHKQSFKTNTVLDFNVTGMFMQYHKFYEGYKVNETQLYFAVFATQHLVADKHYINVQPVYVVFPGYTRTEQKSVNDLLVRADYEYRNDKIGTFNALYYYNNGVQASTKSHAIGINYLKRFDLTKRVNGKVVLTGIKVLNNMDAYYLQSVISAGYSIEL